MTFSSLWVQDLDKFNEFFIDKEEDFIIRIQALDDNFEREQSQDVKRLGQIRKAYADLHGMPSSWRSKADICINTFTYVRQIVTNRMRGLLNSEKKDICFNQQLLSTSVEDKILSSCKLSCFAGSMILLLHWSLLNFIAGIFSCTFLIVKIEDASVFSSYSLLCSLPLSIQFFPEVPISCSHKNTEEAWWALFASSLQQDEIVLTIMKAEDIPDFGSANDLGAERSSQRNLLMQTSTLGLWCGNLCLQVSLSRY